jgi:hypothetical protein
MEMKQDKFTEKTETILIWMTENDAGALAPLISMQIEHGRTLNDSTKIVKVWEAIRALCNTLPNNPIKRGIPSNVPTEVQVLIDALAQSAGEYEAEMHSMGEMSNLICRLGKKSNGTYSNEDYETSMRKKYADSLKKRYSLKIWDGTREGLNNQDFSILQEETGADSEE